MVYIEKIRDYLERNSKIITEIIEDEDTYRLEDVAMLTKLNCEIAEVLLRIEGARDGTVQTPKTSSRRTRKQK